jgi:polyhydroxyalkanoate synthesis regulator phasin
MPRDVKPDPDGPYYVGNLTMFGADAKSRQTVRSTHTGHADSDQQVTLEVTDVLKQLVERGDLKNEMAITLVPAGVAKSRNERFAFDPKSSPRIGAVVLKVEKDE